MAKAENLEDLIIPTTAAKLRGVSKQAIYDLIERGRLPVIEVDGVKFVRRSDVLNFEELPAGRPPKAKAGAVKAGKKGGRK